jgi:hypothetical protein
MRLLPSGFPTKTLCAFIFSLIQTTRPIHIIFLLDLLTAPSMTVELIIPESLVRERLPVKYLQWTNDIQYKYCASNDMKS